MESEKAEIEEQADLVRLLPEDALADVLRLLPHRSLVVSRCVRKAWRDAIDARRMMLRHHLPHLVAGIFIKFNSLEFVEFLARPTTGPKISGKLDFPEADSFVQDHCNGLLLFSQCVANPATRRWAPLPQRPPPSMGMKYFSDDDYLVYDPTVSVHYEVFTIPRILHKFLPGDINYCRFRDKLNLTIEESEWPPSPFVLPVFSSRTGHWEERTFNREGKAAGVVADLRLAGILPKKCYGVYWCGELYVHCGANFVMRLSLSKNKYQIIEPPKDINASIRDGLYLGRSEKGVYCALVDHLDHLLKLQIWVLKESNGLMEWTLEHQTNLKPLLARPHKYNEQSAGPWIFQNINYYYEHHDKEDSYEELEEAKIDWDSDNDDVVQYEDGVDEYHCYIEILGFHPFKDVIFLGESMRRGLAYRFNISKFQDLGNICPRQNGHFSRRRGHLYGSFPYTPCWIDELPLNS